MAIRIVLDGRELAPSEYEADSISVTRSIEPKKDASQEVYFYGEAYALIRTRVIEADLGQMEVLPFQVYDLCCGGALVFDGEIQGKAVEFCDGECFCRAVATARNPLLDCLKGQILSQGLEGYAHPNVPMHKDLSEFEQILADLLQVMVFIFFALLIPALVAVLTFLTIVEKVIQGIDLLLDTLRKVPFLGFLPDVIPGDSRDILPDLSDLPDMLKRMQDLVKKIDQVYYYPSPLVRTMLDNACAQCGAQAGASYSFESPVLDAGYNGLAWFMASGKGRASRTTLGLIDENKPIQTAEDFLNDLSQVFNARWGVDGGTLYMKSRYDLAGDAVDYSGVQACYTFLEEDLPARATLEYTDDPIDTTANAEKDVFDHLEEFAGNSTPALRGKKRYILPFGRHLVEPFKPRFSAGSSMKVLRMARTSCGIPKLLLLEANGKLADSQAMYGSALWASFFQAENPLSTGAKRRRFELTAEYVCGMEVGPGQPIQLSRGMGLVEEVTIDYTGRAITITGTV